MNHLGVCPSCGCWKSQHEYGVIECYIVAWHRGYTITYDAKPIPDRRYDYGFAHEDFDGAPIDSEGPPADSRYGYGESIDDCKRQIDEPLNENAPCLCGDNNPTHVGVGKRE
jgi:hypothetical protein